MNLWRLFRLLAGICLVFSQYWTPWIASVKNYHIAFLLIGCYLIILEFLSFLICWKKSKLRAFVRGYKFWDFGWSYLPITFEICKPHSTEVYVRGSFNEWGLTPLTRDPQRQGWWRVERKLREGEYEYRFFVDGKWENDPNCTNYRPNNYGGQNCIKKVSDTIEYPATKINIRTTFTQILIAISGFALAFIANQSSLSNKKQIIISILISIILGLLYCFVMSGGVIRESTEEDRVIEIGNFHENLMEIILNLQVVMLIFGLSLLSI